MLSRTRLPAAISVVVLTSLFCFAAKHFVMPAAQPANSYPAHDEHPDDKITVALDPYDKSDKASIFTIHYNEVDFLPVFLVITNDGNQPVSLADMKPEFVTVDRAKLPPATEDDLYRRIARPTASDTPSANPLPWPKKKVKGAVSQPEMEEITDSAFAAKAIEPHTTRAGFLFFDVSGISAPLPGSHFYLTGVRDAKGNELMYFEVSLDKYLSPPKP